MAENKFRLEELYDYVKHLTTISSGLLLGITAFADKFGGEWRALLRCSMLCLLVSLGCALFCMLGTISTGKIPEREVSQSDRDLIARLTVASLLALFLAMVCIGVFGMHNI